MHLSSADLVGHLNRTYLTVLDLKVASGELQRPKVWDPVLETLAERGAAHVLQMALQMQTGAPG